MLIYNRIFACTLYSWTIEIVDRSFALNIFFSHIFEQNIYNVLTKNDKCLIDDLVDGIIQSIRDEFVQLNNPVLIFFIDGLMPVSLKNIKSFLIEKVVLFSYRIILNKKGRTW